jgi:hypothetical protein
MLLRIIGYSLLCQHYLTVQSVEFPYESLAQALVLCLRENTQEMSLASLPGSHPGGLARILTSLDSPQQILQETRVTICQATLKLTPLTTLKLTPSCTLDKEGLWTSSTPIWSTCMTRRRTKRM